MIEGVVDIFGKNDYFNTHEDSVPSVDRRDGQNCEVPKSDDDYRFCPRLCKGPPTNINK